MKHLFLLLSTCSYINFCNTQLSLSSTRSEQQANFFDCHPEKLVYRYSNGNKQFEATKRGGDLHGQWISWYSGGQRLDSGWFVKGIPNGRWMAWYKNGNAQFLRTYSSDKWQQFRNEKIRYHPKRVSMPLTKLYHENRTSAERYIKTTSSFCGLQNCLRANESLQEVIDNNGKQEHYHPPFGNGLLHGSFINWFADGAIKDSGSYQSGLPEGIWIKWTDDKRYYWNGHYRHGLNNREWKLYSSGGSLIRIAFYRNGRLLWRKDMKDEVEHTDENISGF